MDNNNNKTVFTIVIYLSNDYYRLTIDSIFAQENFSPEKMQLILLKSRGVRVKDLSDIIADNNCITVSDRTYDNISEAYSASLEYVRGRYVSFAECGSVYRPGVLCGMEGCIEENRDAKLVGVLCDPESEHQNAREINRCFPVRTDVLDLNERYNTPFIFLSNLFINTKLDLLACMNSFETKELFEELFMFRLADQASVMLLSRDDKVNIDPYIGSRFAFNFYEVFRDNKKEMKRFFREFVSGTLNDYQQRLGFVPRYVQYNIMMLLSWTFNAPGAEDIFADEMTVSSFKEYFRDVLLQIDDIVINNCGLHLSQRVVVFDIKYQGQARYFTYPYGKKVYYQNTRLCDMADNPTSIEFVTLTRDRLILHGRVKYLGCKREEFSVYALVNGKTKIMVKDLEHNYDTYIWKENVYSGISFEVEIDLKGLDRVSVELFSVNHGGTVKRKGLRFGKFSPLASNVPDCYYYSDGRVMTYDKDSSEIIVEKCSGLGKFRRELRYLRALRHQKNDYATHAYFARIYYHLIKPFHRKPIWLISDRSNRGDDNGEAFFKYMQTLKHKKVKCYFVIDKSCPEGKRMSKIGRTISTNSKKHKLYHLMSSYVISSQGNNPVVNPLLAGNIYYRDILCKMRFVFLQHGVTKDDISGWLNLYNRNMFGFIVTTNQEYQSVFEYDYFYSPEHVWLTGMPRNDLLYHDEKKYITIMPTWRKSLMTHPDPVTGIWMIRDDFKESKYYQFYNSLLNDERLLSAAEKYGYTICHKPHPNIEPYIDMFDMNDKVKYFATEKTYREIFAESDLMLTDYSSVAFDFAYLGKPIVYAQFDKQAFFSGEHSYTAGYFDYDRDGFGDVTTDLDSTVNCLIEYMENNCRPKQKYLDRINRTFAFIDKDCCKRVYERLMEHEGKNR